MQQSSIIFAALLIGFILFITNKGELGSYIQFLRGGGAQTPTGSNGTAGATGSDTALGSLGSLPSLASGFSFGYNAVAGEAFP